MGIPIIENVKSSIETLNHRVKGFLHTYIMIMTKAMKGFVFPKKNWIIEDSKYQQDKK